MSAADALRDSMVIVRRNVIRNRRVPDVLFFATLQPILFVLLFAYVFGSTIKLAGTSYREFLIAGIFAQTVVFGSVFTGSAIAEDLTKGVMDRFRSLPMSRIAVLLGRTTSDLAINSLSLVVMALTGLAVGWRVRTDLPRAVSGFLLLLAFSFAFSWVMALVGLSVRTPETVNSASFMLLFPLTFVANTFVPGQSLPGPLRAFSTWNPVSSVAQAARDAFGNGAGVRITSHAWPVQHPFAYTLIWAVGLVAVFAPLATRQFERAASR